MKQSECWKSMLCSLVPDSERAKQEDSLFRCWLKVSSLNPYTSNTRFFLLWNRPYQLFVYIMTTDFISGPLKKSNIINNRYLLHFTFIWPQEKSGCKKDWQFCSGLYLSSPEWCLWHCVLRKTHVLAELCVNNCILTAVLLKILIHMTCSL